MGNYKIRLNLDVSDITESSNNTTVNIETEISEEEASSIDSIEKIMLRINYDAIRKAVSEHLENISKKKPKSSKTELEEQLKKIVKNTAWTEK
ncbi:MAG: hypothetical protein PWP27_594 [Clostridiales bacterium]|nr:hypothetical protein [Clostridiales bacterium]MDK2932784.1 hypothetical protein [Clostridiales bacterium]